MLWSELEISNPQLVEIETCPSSYGCENPSKAFFSRPTDKIQFKDHFSYPALIFIYKRREKTNKILFTLHEEESIIFNFNIEKSSHITQFCFWFLPFSMKEKQQQQQNGFPIIKVIKQF